LSETWEDLGEVIRICLPVLQKWTTKKPVGTSSVFSVYTLLAHFPSPALPGSGNMGMISARDFRAPLMI